MRFMLLVKATQKSEAGILPEPSAFEAMRTFNESMVKAGVMLDADGLASSSKGARVSFAGGKPTVTDGPFTETTELVAGYWIISVKSKEEAIEWASPRRSMTTRWSKSGSSLKPTTSRRRVCARSARASCSGPNGKRAKKAMHEESQRRA